MAATIEFPQSQLAALQDHAVRLLDARRPGTDLGMLARDLLGAFFDVCERAGLDRVLAELERELAPLDVTDRMGLADHPQVFRALVAQLEAIDLDGGGPRGVKPRQLVDCVIAALGLTLVAEEDRRIVLGDDVRREVVAAIAAVVDVELAVPRVREAIIAEARAHVVEWFHGAFGKIVAQLDDRALQLIKPPKVPLDALHAVQRALVDARKAVIERAARTALARVKDIIARANTDAAARIDLPVTLRATPREIAILRACDPQLGNYPAKIARSLLDSVTELARLAWGAPERPVHAYAATKTFAVGDVIEHPKFGRGTVVSGLANRIDVEFPDGKHVLVHVPTRK